MERSGRRPCGRAAAAGRYRPGRWRALKEGPTQGVRGPSKTERTTAHVGTPQPANWPPSRQPVKTVSFAVMRTARRTHGVTESVIRVTARLSNEHGAINLAQGFPNFPCPYGLEDAPACALRDDVYH